MVALLSAGALLFSSTSIGLYALSRDVRDGLDQVSRRPSSPLTQVPTPIFLGSHPGRDRLGRGGMWSASRRADAARSAQRGLRNPLPQPLWAGPAAMPQVAPPAAHTLAISPEPGASYPWEGSNGGVNTGNGNKLTKLSLLSWKVRGGGTLDFTLYHNSQSNYNDELGSGWTWTYDVYINNLTSNPVVHWGDGGSVPYTAPSGGGGGGGGGGFDIPPSEKEESLFASIALLQGTPTTYTSPAGIHDALVKNADSTWTLTKKGGTKYVFNAAGFLTQIRDRNANTITLTLNASNYVTKITDPTGRYVNVSVNGSNKFTGITDQTGRTWSFTQNGSGDLTTVTWPSLGDGNTYTDGFSYSSHRIASHTDRRGKAWTFAYNTDGSIASQTDPLSHTTTYSFGATATSVTDPLGHVTTDNYSSGALASQVDASGYSVSYTARNANFDVTSSTDRRGKVWGKTFDSNGNILTSTDPLGHVRTMTYNGFSELLTSSDPLSHSTSYTYDSAGNLLTITNALSKTILTNVIGSYGLVSSSTNALGKTTTFSYTSDGDVQTIIDPLSAATTRSYDALGRATGITDAASKTTTTTYDAWGRPIQVTFPATTGSTGASSYTTYLPTGQTKTVTDELGHTGTSTYDDAGRLTSVTNPRGDVETYGYDNANRRTTLTNGRGKVRTYTYTNRGDVASLTMPDSSVESWSYDGAGNKTAYVTPLSQTILYTFDNAGRPTGVDYPTGTDTTYTYDNADRRTSMVDATGTTSCTYDNADHLTVFSAPQGSQTSVFDDAGQRVGLSGTSIARTWTYDDDGRPLTTTNEQSETTTNVYDSLGRLTKTTLANGQVSLFGYDARGRQTSVIHKTSNTGSTISSETYIYDDAGNLTSKTVNGTTTTYGYDNVNQLTSEAKTGYSASYTYDANGNRTSKTLGGVTDTYTVDDGDKLTSVSQGSTTIKSYGYDAAGRTTSVVSSAGTTTLSYDYESRVTGITYPGGATNSFAYNGLDTRVGKVDSAGTSTYRRDGAGVTDPVLSDGTAFYTPGVSQRRSGVTIYDLSDRLGTASTQTNASSTTTATRTYDAFGILTANSGTPAGPFGFAGTDGYQEDADSGLKLLGHRYYDASTGRFLTRDPSKSGRSWYAYCANNPLKSLDPLGLFTIGDMEFTWDGFCEAMQTVSDAYDSSQDFGYGDDGSHDSQPGYEVSKHLFEIAHVCEIAIEILEGIGEDPVIGGGGGGQCFVAGTQVVLADGTTKAIQDIRPGDKVRSRSERSDEKGRLETATVENEFELHAPETLLLKFQGGATLEVTSVHPMYVVGKGFTPAGLIKVGDQIAEDRDNTTAKLASVVRLTSPKPVYNLTVGGTHTYFVRVGHDDLWAHNAGQCGSGPGDIHPGQQGKHIPGDNNFKPGKSELTHPDPQDLLNRGGGTGSPITGTPGQAGGKELVNFGEPIGVSVNPVTGVRTPTDWGIIHYGGSGSHIVPTYPR
jgi:RHS repeat-associated protein